MNLNSKSGPRTWASLLPSEPKLVVRNKSSLLAVEYSGRKVAILRSTSYTGTISSIKKAFGGLQYLANPRIQLFTKIDQVDARVQVVEELWAELVPYLSLITVVTSAASPFTINANTLPDNHIQVRVKLFSGTEETFNVPLTCTVDRLKSMIQERMFHTLTEDDFYLDFEGTMMCSGGTLASYGVENWDEIHAMRELRIGKPVIYLFSPTPLLDVRVQLSLVDSWRFSAIYPPVPIDSPSDESLGQAITWAVDTKSDGLLWDRLTNREVAYLFWEAHTNPKPPISPPVTPSAEIVGFDPARPSVLPSNSALLSFDKITGYIDDALLAMELHAEARTSFITYWLPNLSKHTHIALRFLPQDQYEASAPLHVIPAPNITTRVFMLFMGVQEVDLGAWKAAQVPAQEWSRIVGVDRAKAKDVSLFRVLEWGGMEIQ